MDAGQSSPGFYGKFPELGDFVNRRIPRSFLEPWDEWLQSCISYSRQQLGEDWLNLYLNSPIWRFVLSGGLCGEVPWCGLVMPSVDRVGRYYPLVIAQRLPLDACLFQVAVDGEGWFDRAEALILTVLEQQDFDLDHFDGEVEKLEGMYRLAEAGGTSTLTGYGSSWRIAMDQDVRLGRVLPAMMHQLVLQRLGPYSIWWSAGSNSVQPSVLVCTEMPPATDFSALLSGNWTHGAWEEWPLPLGGSQALENAIEEESD